jgi:hypothetical protein
MIPRVQQVVQCTLPTAGRFDYVAKESKWLPLLPTNTQLTLELDQY